MCHCRHHEPAKLTQAHPLPGVSPTRPSMCIVAGSPNDPRLGYTCCLVLHHWAILHLELAGLPAEANLCMLGFVCSDHDMASSPGKTQHRAQVLCLTSLCSSNQARVTPLSRKWLRSVPDWCLRLSVLFQWFLTALSVRPGRVLAMLAHLLPCSCSSDTAFLSEAHAAQRVALCTCAFASFAQACACWNEKGGVKCCGSPGCRSIQAELPWQKLDIW